MSKKKHKKEKRPPIKMGGLFIQKKKTKNGRFYYFDKDGKRRKKIEYESQWSINGRVSKESFEKTIKTIKKQEITDIQEAKLIANDYEILRRAEPKRKKEIELMESETSGSQLFFRATDTIRDAIAGGATIKIQTPTNQGFRTMDAVNAMDNAHRFIDSINDSVDEINEASGETVTSPLIQFNFEHDVEKNIFYIDFKNVTGFDDFVLLRQLIKDNFEVDQQPAKPKKEIKMVPQKKKLVYLEKPVPGWPKGWYEFVEQTGNYYTIRNKQGEEIKLHKNKFRK